MHGKAHLLPKEAPDLAGFDPAHDLVAGKAMLSSAVDSQSLEDMIKHEVFGRIY